MKGSRRKKVFDFGNDLQGGVGCEGRGDIGVRFDKLNELRGGAVSELAAPELVEGFLTGMHAREIAGIVLYEISIQKDSNITVMSKTTIKRASPRSSSP